MSFKIGDLVRVKYEMPETLIPDDLGIIIDFPTFREVINTFYCAVLLPDGQMIYVDQQFLEPIS